MLHQPFYFQAYQKQRLFHNSHESNYFFLSPHSSFYYSNSIANQSICRLNFSRILQYLPMSSYPFTSMTRDTYLFNNLTNQWKQNMIRNLQQNYRTPIYYFHDKSAHYYMSNPIITNNNRLSVNKYIVFLS